MINPANNPTKVSIGTDSRVAAVDLVGDTGQATDGERDEPNSQQESCSVEQKPGKSAIPVKRKTCREGGCREDRIARGKGWIGRGYPRR
ncbi:MAG: hypothetical protein ACLU4N_13035 [Butyricimonas faecihominis]